MFILKTEKGIKNFGTINIKICRMPGNLKTKIKEIDQQQEHARRIVDNQREKNSGLTNF